MPQRHVDISDKELIMGFMDKVFGSSKSGGGFQTIPDTPESKKAREYLMPLLDNDLNFPTRVIPGMTDLEKQAQTMIAGWLNSGTPAGYTAATNQLTKTVEGGYDPYNSDEYKGYRDASKIEENNMVNSLRRSLQIQGMNASSPEIRKEGQARRGYSADRMSMLGSLYNRERDRQVGAAPVLAGVTDARERLTADKATVGAAMGAIPREIETAQEQAIFDAIMKTLLAPYNEKLNVASTILGEPRAVYDPGVQSPSLFSQIMGPVSMLGAGYLAGR